jgi:membrane protein DedA with SNARE-associated domain
VVVLSSIHPVIKSLLYDPLTWRLSCCRKHDFRSGSLISRPAHHNRFLQILSKARALSLEDLISHYGALAVFLGAAAEGETAAFLGGVLAHRHLLTYWQAAVAAALGSFVADQAFFLVGRHAGKWRFVRRFTQSKAMSHVTRLLETYPTGFILSFRFIYGVRTVSPIAIGLSSIPAWRFVFLNFIAAVIWGIVITAVGYLFGNAVEALFGRLRLHIHLLIALAVILALTVVGALLARKYFRTVPADRS